MRRISLSSAIFGIRSFIEFITACLPNRIESRLKSHDNGRYEMHIIVGRNVWYIHRSLHWISGTSLPWTTTSPTELLQQAGLQAMVNADMPYTFQCNIWYKETSTELMALACLGPSNIYLFHTPQELLHWTSLQAMKADMGYVLSSAIFGVGAIYMTLTSLGPSILGKATLHIFQRPVPLASTSRFKSLCIHTVQSNI